MSEDNSIHPLLRQRRSPYRFDPNRSVNQNDLQALFEAARWSMSAFNEQPWRYIVGVKDRSLEVWQQVLSVLVEGNQRWAQHVPVLALGLMDTRFKHNGKENRWAMHDLGAASAYLTLEATSRGLSVHQMAGIEPGLASQVFELEPQVVPVTALAIGYLGANDALDADIAARDDRPRERRAIDEMIVVGGL